jgi:hypothetical protein
MKLTELKPRLTENTLVFDCPCARCKAIRANPDDPKFTDQCAARIRLPLKPLENGWDIVGGTFPDTLSLSPSILIGGRLGGLCDWHGYLTDGEMRPC